MYSWLLGSFPSTLVVPYKTVPASIEIAFWQQPIKQVWEVGVDPAHAGPVGLLREKIYRPKMMGIPFGAPDLGEVRV